uniref:Uncharacterized protein n=1 Tax=Caulerpa cliftonii TaxID=1004391 RepID=A0A1C9JBQ4_9CHLO|nr:hypothetical protein [Caulerpa cliftonii]AOP19273.1 hypothetical protein [Caulerpa cliftonii]
MFKTYTPVGKILARSAEGCFELSKHSPDDWIREDSTVEFVLSNLLEIDFEKTIQNNTKQAVEWTKTFKITIKEEKSTHKTIDWILGTYGDYVLYNPQTEDVFVYNPNTWCWSVWTDQMVTDAVSRSWKEYK